MLTPVMDGAGLGFFLDQQNPGQFGHNGADEGFQALLTMNADTGNGVAIMANSDNGVYVANLLFRSVAKEYGWNFKGQDDPEQVLFLLMRAQGTAAALKRYKELKNSGAKDTGIDEQTLNTLGYLLLQAGQTQDAIAVFQRNVQEYPQSYNVYDSLGEAYMDAGQKDLAISNYEKSMQINPENKNGAEKLKQLKANP
jgi:tetratricopeptide (TPR) repeat protein